MVFDPAVSLILRCLVQRVSLSLVRVFLAVAAACAVLAVLAVSSSAQTASKNLQYVTAQAATVVIGQKNFSDNIPGADVDQVGSISGVAVAGDLLVVADGGTLWSVPSNNRVLIYPSVSSLPRFGAKAAVVIGQPDFTTTAPGLSESLLNRPVGVSTDGRRLAIADANNNRILVYNQIPTTNGAAADVVVGQSGFKSNTPNTSPTGLRDPEGVFIDGTRLYVADTLNHRVLIFNSIPTSGGAKADVVLGQLDMNASGDHAASAGSLRSPTSVFYDGTRLIVTDLGHNRVLIYNHLPTSSNPDADVVVGQADFSKEDAGVGAAQMSLPRCAVSDGTRLFVADAGNNRILVFNQIPTTNGAAADVVLGQRDFITDVEPDASDPQRLTSMILGTPMAVAVANSGLFVADSDYRRVLQFMPGVPMLTLGAAVNAATFGGNGLVRPTNVNVEVEADDTSTLAAGTYYIRISAQGGILFESMLSQEVAVTVPADNSSKLVVTFDEVPNATEYRAYIGLTPGGQLRYFTTTTPASGEAIDRTVTINSLTGASIATPQAQITPGSIEVLFGDNLADDTYVAQQIPLPTQLGGTSVLVNGVPAPLFLVSPTQINFQTPWATLGSSSSLVVRKTSPSGEVTLSTALSVPVSDLTPGVFTVNGDGTGPPLAFHSDYTLIDNDHPLIPGESIIFFATGVQAVDVVPADGAASPVSNITTTVAIIIANYGTTLQYSGLAPGFVGVSQFNVQTVSDIPSDGTPAELRVVIGAIPANQTFIPVKGGTISVGVAPDYTVTWSAVGFEDAQVFVSVDAGDETLFASGLSGSLNADAIIESGHVYVFNLRAVLGGVVGDVIASTLVDVRATANIGTPFGAITVGPGPDYTVKWKAGLCDDTQVSVSTDGGTETVLSSGLSGSLNPDFVEPGHVYVFNLRSVTAGTVGGIIASATLDTRVSIAVGPGPDYTVTWTAPGYEDAQVFVSTDSGNEILFATGLSGSLNADFIEPGHVYVFNLRSVSGGTVGGIIASATVDTRSP
jgi:uncharacterized protein (TIGR03437 family)